MHIFYSCQMYPARYLLLHPVSGWKFGKISTNPARHDFRYPTDKIFGLGRGSEAEYLANWISGPFLSEMYWIFAKWSLFDMRRQQRVKYDKFKYRLMTQFKFPFPHMDGPDIKLARYPVTGYPVSKPNDNVGYPARELNYIKNKQSYLRNRER